MKWHANQMSSVEIGMLAIVVNNGILLAYTVFAHSIAEVAAHHNEVERMDIVT